MKVLKITPILAFCIVVTLGLTGCGGGSGGSGSPGAAASNNSGAATGGNSNPFIPPSQSSSGSTTSSSSGQGSSGSVGNLGLVLIPSDAADEDTTIANSPSIMQIVHIYDSNGNVLASPTMSSLSYAGINDFDGAALTPDGSEGVMMDGDDNNLYYFSVKNGEVSTAHTISANYGVDGDSVAILSSGDEAVITLDNNGYLILVSGILSGTPQTAASIPVPDYRDGLVSSNDDKVLLARGADGLTVFAINAIPPQPGQGGFAGTVSHTFTQTANIVSLGTSKPDGASRDGMAISPMDSSRAVVITNITNTTSSSTVDLLTGLPGNPVVSNSISVSPVVDTVAISPDGNLAIVGTDSGLLMFSGVASGALQQVGQLYAPSYTVNNGSVTLGKITTLGFTVDGKYVVVCDYTNSALLVIPVSTSGFGTPAGILPGISAPWSDNMMVH